MPRTPVHTVDSAPEASRDVLKVLEARMGGKVLNIHGEMAHSPAVINAYAALKGVIAEHGTFDAATQEAIALAVSAVDDCTYCQAAHTAAGRRAGLSADERLAVRAGASEGLGPKLAALVAIARAYTAEVGEVPDELWQAGLDAGWTDAQLAELSVHVTINQLTNHFNHYIGTDLDLPAAPAL